MTAASTGAYTNAGNGVADALKGGTAAAPSTITLGTGADHVAVGGGWWDITLPGANSTVVVNPVSGNIDTITALGGHDTITVGAVGGGGGETDIYTGGSFNLVQFDQSGALPQLQSADIINNTPGGEYNTVQVIAGGVEMFDANWSQIRGYEDFWVVGGVTNQIQLNYNANADAQSVAGLANATALVGDAPVVTGVLASTLTPTTGLDIISGGGGSADATTSVNVGAGFNSPLTFTVGLGGDLGGDNVMTHLASVAGSNPLTVFAQTNDFNMSFESAPTITVAGSNFGMAEGIFATTSAVNTLELVADSFGSTAAIYGNGHEGLNGVSTILGGEPSYVADNSMGVTILPGNTDALNLIDLHLVTGNSAINALTYSMNALTLIGGTGATDLLLGGSVNGNAITANGHSSNQIFGGTGTDNVLTGAGGSGGATTTFIFSALNQSNAVTGVDTITNFNPATDVPRDQPGDADRGRRFGHHRDRWDGPGRLVRELQRGPGGVEPDPRSAWRGADRNRHPGNLHLVYRRQQRW